MPKSTKPSRVEQPRVIGGGRHDGTGCSDRPKCTTGTKGPNGIDREIRRKRGWEKNVIFRKAELEKERGEAREINVSGG